VLANDFNVGIPIIAALCAIAAYIVGKPFRDPADQIIQGMIDLLTSAEAWRRY